MAWTTIAAIYFVIWWTVLFVVLPWGIKSQHEVGDIVPGTDPGAPVVTGFRSKLIWTTIVSTIVFLLFYIGYVNHIATLDDLATLWGLLGNAQPR
jgi:predicted secreted protein